MDVLLSIVFYGALVLLAGATFVLLSAAELLKQYVKEDLEADAARYHSKPIAAVAVVLGVISYFIAESPEDTLLVALVPYVLIIAAGMLNASWWYMYHPMVFRYVKYQLKK